MGRPWPSTWKNLNRQQSEPSKANASLLQDAVSQMRPHQSLQLHPGGAFIKYLRSVGMTLMKHERHARRDAMYPQPRERRRPILPHGRVGLVLVLTGHDV